MAGEVIRWFPLERVRDLEAAIASELRSDRPARRRDAIAVALGLHGMRVGEVCRAERKHFFAAGQTLDVPEFKRGRGRKIPLHESVVTAILAELTARTQSSPFLLASCRGGKLQSKQPQILASAIFDSLLGPHHGLTFHSLRHTFAMRLYAETKDLFLCQRYLGHRSVKNTEVYARSLAEIPDSCMVKIAVGSGVVMMTSGRLPGAQLKLFS